MPINKFVDFNKKIMKARIGKKLHVPPKGSSMELKPKKFTFMGKGKKGI